MQKNNNAIALTSIIAGVSLVVARVALFTYGRQGSVEEDTLTVQGVSTIKVLPDWVSVYFIIQTNGTTSAEASEDNNEIYNRLYNALIRDGFKNSEIGTESFNVYPNTYYDNGAQRTDGFIAAHQVKVEFSTNETGKISLVVDDGINAGAGVSYINFELSTNLQNQYKAQALEEASIDAKAKADAVAKGFGKSVGKLVTVSVDNYNYYPWVMYSAEGVRSDSSAKLAAQNINPTTQDVTAMISATYKLV